MLKVCASSYQGGVMLLHLTLTPSLPSQGKSLPTNVFFLSSDAQMFEICFFHAKFGVWLDEHMIIDF